MKRILWIVVFLVLAGVAGAEEDAKLRVALELVDGSQIFGVPELKALPIRTSYAEMAIPVTNLSSVVFGKDDESPKINLANGDQIRGGIDLQALALQTVIGKHSVAVKHIAAMHFSMDGTFALKKKLAPVRLPAIIPWKDVPGRLDEAKVVVVCLVDSFDLKERAPRGYTPAQMLEMYLQGVRRLAKGQDEAGNPLSPDNLRVFVVECGPETRNWAAVFSKDHNVPDYDRSIPVIFVFHKGRAMERFTYVRSPGRDGSGLLNSVKKQLARE